MDPYLLDEALKRAPVVWVARADGSEPRAVWCAYDSPHLLVASGADEQPTPPALTDGGRVRLIVRSKDDRHRLLDVEMEASRVSPDDPDHDEAWRAADAARLHRTLDPSAAGLVLHRLSSPT